MNMEPKLLALHVSFTSMKFYICSQHVLYLYTYVYTLTDLDSMAMSMPIFFNVDHPFCYAIVDDEFTPLFQGTIIKF